MGRLQKTCGAVTGAFMVLGIYNSSWSVNSEESREKTIVDIQDFSHKFKLLNGSTNCGLLLNCDLKTENGQNYFIDNNLGETVCCKCVPDSINILSAIIK